MYNFLNRFLILFTFCLLANTFNIYGITISGKISAHGTGIANVPVTDGTNIVKSGVNGRYTITVQAQKTLLYYCLPSGYESPIENGIPVFYHAIEQNKLKQTINFELTKSTKDQNKHNFILWADPQVMEQEEFKLLEEVAEDLRKTVASFPSTIPVHAISAGDNVFDRLNLFTPYKELVSKIKLPFYQLIGNHDMDYNNRSNELSDLTFKKAFGPSHYSFNRGKVHYVVLKDVFYYGYNHRYIGYIDENQLKWLEKDLQLVKPGSTVIVSLHIPTIYGESEKTDNYGTTISNSVMNRDALYKILSPFNTHILAGHSHTNWHTQATPNIVEHVHAAACGAWWQGEVCVDGSPKGYTVYQIDGDSVTWYFKGLNQSKSYQFKYYPVGSDSTNPDCFIVNVFNFDEKWKVFWYENGELKGEMARFWGIDPFAAQLYQPGKGKKYSWVNAGSTYHLFKAKPEKIDSKITIKVIDRFGNVYN